MNGGNFFSILTMVILALFAVVFGVLYFYDRKQRFTGWVSSAYFAGMAAFVIDINRALLPPVPAELAGNTFNWAVGIFLMLAFAARLNKPAPVRVTGCLLIAAYACQLWYSFAEPDITMRAITANISCTVILAAILPMLWRANTTAINRAIFWIVTLLALSYAVRPVVTFGILNERFTEYDYDQSFQAMGMHMAYALSALTGAVAMLIAAGSDIIVRMQRESVVDPLTGVLNRRGYEGLLDGGTGRTDTDIVGRAVMMFDIDHFKQVNDCFGHHVGDEILMRIAKTASGITRHHGEIARVGGEEFAVILSGPSSAVAREIAEHLRLAFGLLVHPELPDGATVTASFGLAYTKDGESVKRALRRADIALYAAKDSGRNCMVEHREQRKIEAVSDTVPATGRQSQA